MKKPEFLRRRPELVPLLLYFCILIFLDTAFRLFYPSDVISWRDPMPMAFTLGWALIMTAAAALLPGRGGKIWMIATGAFFSFLVLVHCVMQNLFGKFFALQDLNFAGVGAKFFSLRYLQVRLPMVICLVVTVLGCIGAAVLLPKKEKGTRKWWAAPLAAGVVLLCVLHGCNLTAQVEGTMAWDTSINAGSKSSRKVLYTEFTNPNTCMALTGVYHYTVRNAAVTLNPFQGADEKQAVENMDAFYEENKPIFSDLQGSQKGKNLVMIMLESVDSFLLTEQIMPNLYAVQQQSVNYVNHYTPMYLTAGTFGTEFLTQTGLIPPQSGASTSVYVGNAYPYSLANLFRQAGYTANSFHSAVPAIYNRGAIHQNLGFEAYHSAEEMGMTDYMRDSELAGGFDQMIKDEPFFSFIITYSGHGPYDATMDNIAAPHLERAKQVIEAAGYTGSEENMQELIRATAHAMETDAFIGQFMEYLEESGHKEDTVVVFYADHYCKYMTDPAFLMQIKGVENRNMLCNTPMFIYGTGLAPQTANTLVSSIDIYPTVCSMFGLTDGLRWSMGTDVFADKARLVMWPDYSWYDGNVYVDGGAAPSDEYEAQTSAVVREKLRIAWDTVIYDYFR